MNTPAATPYKGHRFPHEIISHAVWLYFRFSLSYRDVEELLAERGLIVTYESVRQWCLKCGQTYANALRRRRPKTGDKWHLDEVFLKINGQPHDLWRAVDQAGNVLDILVQRRRNKAAAKQFFRKLLTGGTYVPRVLITDKLARDGAAKREVLPSVERAFERAFEAAQAWNNHVHMANVRVNQAQVAQARSRWDHAHALVDEARTLLGESADPFVRNKVEQIRRELARV